MNGLAVLKTNDRFKDVGLLAVRLGIAFGFIFPGIMKVSNPANLANMMSQMMGMDPSMLTQLVFAIGVFEILSGILVAIGLITRVAAIFQLVILIGAQAMFGFNYTQGPAIWKDPSMLGVAILLLLYGSGRFSIDAFISRKR